jgi:hypothetical protein
LGPCWSQTAATLLFAVAVAETRGWCAAEYVSIVEEQLSKANLQTLFVIRDNDPKGYDTTRGRAAEEACTVTALALPKRSPNLQALDYTFHKAVAQVLRRQEKQFPANKVESRDEFKERLLAAYHSLSKETVEQGCAAMLARLRRLHDAGGANVPGD